MNKQQLVQLSLIILGSIWLNIGFAGSVCDGQCRTDDSFKENAAKSFKLTRDQWGQMGVTGTYNWSDTYCYCHAKYKGQEFTIRGKNALFPK
ncbi:MAG TPA: hypothetical protein VHM20_00120 [Gammaproteobacteria bacterium]|jgi:hypothetical protein|nr:hypothetical protein [Gammaproteobacteria bacterium]